MNRNIAKTLQNMRKIDEHHHIYIIKTAQTAL